MTQAHSFPIKPPSSKEYPKEYLDPIYWHPESEGFVLFDWDKWLAKNPSVPKVYGPPQRSSYFRTWSSIPLWWWNRSCYLQPLAFCCRPCSPKPEMERISDVKSGALFTGLLGPNPNPENIPEPFRNKLLWTRENIAPETLISFNRWAWRSNTPEGRVVGVGTLGIDWSNDASCFGLVFAYQQPKSFANVQVSPDGKWILLNAFRDPKKGGKMNYLWMYVVQEGDVFTSTDGKVLDWVKPGDLLRVTWNQNDPYECNNELVNYMYFIRTVATLDEEKGTVTLEEENFSELFTNATNDPGCGTCLATCCYTCSCCMSGEDRFDFQVSNISDRQIFSPSATPPESNVVDRL